MMNAVGKWLENDKTPGRKVSIGLGSLQLLDYLFYCTFYPGNVNR